MSIYKISRWTCKLCRMSYNNEIHNTIGKVIRNSLTDPLPCIATLQKTQFRTTRRVFIGVSKRWVADFWKKIYYQGWSPWHRRRLCCSKPENVNRAYYWTILSRSSSSLTLLSTINPLFLNCAQFQLELYFLIFQIEKYWIEIF